MLTALRIENYAIVKQLTLEFSEGMTAFTGETGAGKSIMIDALMLVLGGRGDASVIRPGEEKCDISAVFQIEPDSLPYAFLEQYDLLTDTDVILRRVIYAEGRSRAFINGQPFPLQKIKLFAEMLVHIHGQHEHQTLLHHATHRHQLDRFGKHGALLAAVGKAYQNCQAIKQDMDVLRDDLNMMREMALLQFQIDELTALHIQPEEMQQLSQEHHALHHAKDYMKQADVIINLLDGQEDTPAIVKQLYQALQGLAHMPSDHQAVQSALALLQQAVILCEEASHEIQQFVRTITLDETRLQTIESRMSVLHQVARKYHVKAEDLLEKLDELSRQYLELKTAENRYNDLEKEYAVALSAYQAAAKLLHDAREDASGRLAREITAIIRKLGMPKGEIVLNITELDAMHEHGRDKVEYLVCTNPGMSFDALGKIASGGELSRLSLAIQMVTAERGSTPTLLFDEVDVGIGGATAAKVGRLLRDLGSRLQVFCVTHQPQVASAAHHHFMVNKVIQKCQTYSDIVILTDDSKVDEIARMLGGLKINEDARAHARSLIQEFV